MIPLTHSAQYRAKGEKPVKTDKSANAKSCVYGALGDPAHQFIELLRRQGYRKCSIQKYKRCLLQVGRLMVKKRMKADQLTEGSLVGLLTSIDAPASVVRSPEFTAKRFIRFLADRGLVKLPLPRPEAVARAELRQDYETYLRQQRGLSERTIFHCWRFADRFLSFCFGEGMGDLSATTQEDIARFLQNITKNRQSPLRDRTPPTHLRNFFRYLFKVGKMSVNLAPVVPKIRQRRDTRLPGRCFRYYGLTLVWLPNPPNTKRTMMIITSNPRTPPRPPLP
jgi:integrase/recombinase XerD